MESVAISFGSIILLGFVLYFAIKAGVRNGINESMLLTAQQKKEREEEDNNIEYEEIEEAYKDAGKEMPEHLKEYYGKKRK